VIEAKIKLPISQRWTEGEEFTVDVREGQIEVEVARANGQYSVLAATA
jgi:hypothetical protein